MPDHLHWLVALGDRTELSAAVKMFKVSSARRVNDFLQRSGSLWQRAYYDHALRRDEDVKKIARYIVANPLRAGLVEHIGDYPLWDAMWL
ncbi:REP-associated tyrosine transposase [Methylobacter sp.]|uniref:REP-associated tyrosine transposase n=1 Tax=Methylobacter sp. TaxID=2051955 RepID=UPI003DA52D73